MVAGLRDLVERDGFAIIPNVVDTAVVSTLITALNNVCDDIGVRRRQEIYAIRNLLEIVPSVRTLVESPSIRRLVESVLNASSFVVVRSLLFDKTTGANWKVNWHQDCSIAVRSRIDVPGFEPWSIKAGVPHVNAPVSVLEKMLAVRVHLDDCDKLNGPLLVIPGSHRLGRLSLQEVQKLQQRGLEVPCLVPSGGVLLMKPLLLHASGSSSTSYNRRVVHLEFSAETLPGGLDWHLPTRL